LPAAIPIMRSSARRLSAASGPSFCMVMATLEMKL
jgi:hypothetical protein